MTLTHTTPSSIAEGVHIDREAVLQALNLNPRDPKVQALVLVCQQYGLDPVLKHAVLISGNLYVTRDGLLAVAQRSGDLDGIVVEDEGETSAEWWAKVSVYRRSMSHPFTYRGRYPKSGHQKKYGPEMAVKCAEVMALRRAFGVTGIATVEEQWDKHDDAIDAELVTDPNPEPPAHPAVIDDILERLNSIGDTDARREAKQKFVTLFGPPGGLRASQVGEASKFVASVLAGPVVGDGVDAVVVPARGPDQPLDVVVPSFVDPPAQPGSEGRLHEGIPSLPQLMDDTAAARKALTDAGLAHEAVEAEGFPPGWLDKTGPEKTAALRKARKLAADSGVPVPGSFDEIDADLAVATEAA